MSRRHLNRLALASVRRWGYHGGRKPAKYALQDQRLLRIFAAQDRRKDGCRIWWPRSAGVCCTDKHGFSRTPIAQAEGSLFHRRHGRREPIVPFRRSRLDYDLPF